MHEVATKAEVPSAIRPFINGRFEDSRSASQVVNYSPYTGTALYSFLAGSTDDVDRAVTAARVAFDDGRWSEAPPSFRQRVLLRFADLVERHAVELDCMDAREMGKPVSVAFCNSAMSAAFLRFCAEAVDKMSGDVLVSDVKSYISQRRVPCGVVGAIASWNFPAFVALLKVAPALAAGNTVVLKPSEISPSSALQLAQLAVEAGIPEGVLNVVPGIGADVGKPLSLHGDVDLISFTGSTPVGKQILAAAGQSNLKRVVLECGGKSPQIVFDDGVRLEVVASAIAASILRNQGQVCSAGTRVLVQKSLERRLLDALAARFQDVKVGDPLDPQTTFGPLATRSQLVRVKGAIEEAMSAGATLEVGGTEPYPHHDGYFVRPTLFSKVDHRMPVAREEIFGPVLAVTSFDSAADAVRMANSTDFGLSATIWTKQLQTGLSVAKKVRCTVSVNTGEYSGEGARFASTSEPAGQSGFGAEGGIAGIQSYQRRQTISIFHG